MTKNKHISTTEVAKMLGISRVAVFYKIKKGDIPAVKVGRNYVIHPADLLRSSGSELTAKDRRCIAHAVKRTVGQYRKTLELLGRE